MSLANDIECFLAAGGRINVMPGFQERPRRPHRQPPPKPPAVAKPTRERIPEWAQRDMVLNLMRDGQLRIVDLAKESGVPVQRLGMQLDGTFNPKPADARRIEEAAVKLATTRRKRGK